MHRHLLVAVSAIAFSLAACANTTTTPLSRDVVQISASAAPVCGSSGAQSLAAKMAAVETISRGYDGFIVLDGASSSNVGVVGYTPRTSNTTYNTYGTYGGGRYNATTSGYTTYGGGAPIIAGSHDRDLMIQMFKRSDPAFVEAVDARAQLGPDWQKIVESRRPMTCM